MTIEHSRNLKTEKDFDSGELMLKHLPDAERLAEKMARQRGLDVEEARAEAALTVVKGVKQWDESKGVRLGAYLSNLVKITVMRMVRPHVRDRIFTSLEGLVENEWDVADERYVRSELAEQNNERRDRLHRAIQTLPSPEQRLLAQRYREGMTQTQIAKAERCSRLKIQRAEAKILNKLRAMVGGVQAPQTTVSAQKPVAG